MAATTSTRVAGRVFLPERVEPTRLDRSWLKTRRGGRPQPCRSRFPEIAPAPGHTRKYHIIGIHCFQWKHYVGQKMNYFSLRILVFTRVSKKARRAPPLLIMYCRSKKN